MDLISEENYIIAQAKQAVRTDPFAAKSWIITAKTLFPNNFGVQFEAYKIEKGASNYEEAAKCFSHLILTFQNQPGELWNEVGELTAALRAPEVEITQPQEYYVKMFQHLSYDVQHKILLLTVNHTENNFEQCKLLLLLLKRFPQAIATQTARILELIAQGMAADTEKYRDMLEKEALPLIYYYKIPEGFEAEHLVCRIFTISLEYYVKQLFEEEHKNNSNKIWKKIFFLLTICGAILNWEISVPFEEDQSKDVYWQKILEIVSTRNSDKNDVFYYALTLFIYSLQEYIEGIHHKTEEHEIDYILTEGFRELPESINPHETPLEPIISTNLPCSKDTTTAFVTAANCWRLLNSQNVMELGALIVKLPLSEWLNQFIYDLNVYVGNHEEARILLNDSQLTGVTQNIRSLGLVLTQGPLTVAGYDYILKVLSEVPTIPGALMKNMTVKCHQRHLILLPLTQRTVIQYCTLAIMNTLKHKIFEPNCPDMVLGNLLVLSQLEYPREHKLAEQIFEIINTKNQFTYLLFPAYMIIVDYIEEFMYIWNSTNGAFNLEFTASQTNLSGTRRIGTRGADKGVKEDFKQIIKQQISRCHDDIFTLIAQFITQERMHLMAPGIC